MNEPRLLMKFAEAKQAVLSAAQERKKTILIYSPDLNFCFSLSTVFQDRYEVVTTTDPDFLDSFTTHYATDLVVVDADPSNRMITRFQAMKKRNENIPSLSSMCMARKELKWTGLSDNMWMRCYTNRLMWMPLPNAYISCCKISPQVTH